MWIHTFVLCAEFFSSLLLVWFSRHNGDPNVRLPSKKHTKWESNGVRYRNLQQNRHTYTQFQIKLLLSWVLLSLVGGKKYTKNVEFFKCSISIQFFFTAQTGCHTSKSAVLHLSVVSFGNMLQTSHYGQRITGTKWKRKRTHSIEVFYLLRWGPYLDCELERKSNINIDNRFLFCSTGLWTIIINFYLNWRR